MKEQAPAEVAVVEPVAATTPEPTVVERKARPKRSAAAERERAVLTRLNRKAADRQRTRAHQDAALLMRDEPVFVATDPTRMVAPLLAKDGPAERRARRLAGEDASPAVLASFTMTEKRQRAMRRNLHATRFAERIRRVGVLADRAGAIHCTPGHEGTSAGCPGCDRVRRKDLRERWHECPCGLSMPRDQASALMTLGRALLPFRLSPDRAGPSRRPSPTRRRHVPRSWPGGRRGRRHGSPRRRCGVRRGKMTARVPPGNRGVVPPGPQPQNPDGCVGRGETSGEPTVNGPPVQTDPLLGSYPGHARGGSPQNRLSVKETFTR